MRVEWCQVVLRLYIVMRSMRCVPCAACVPCVACDALRGDCVSD